MRRSILKLIHEQSPKAPACFDSQAQWVEWLTGAHSGGAKVVRRVDIGKSAGNRVTHFEVLPIGQQPHCSDCSAIRQAKMKAAGRCFPVTVVDEEPEATDSQEPDGRRQFSVSGIATLRKIDVRKQGKDDARVLAIHASLEFARIDAAVCNYFDEMLGAFLWRQEVMGRVVRNAALQPVVYSHQISGASVEIEGVTFNSADVKNFVIKPIDGSYVALACCVSLYPGGQNVSGLINRVRDGVRIKILGPLDLFDAPEAKEPKAPAKAQQVLI